MKKLIQIEDVRPGMFSTERYVAFEIDGKEYSLFVDHASVHENERTLEVQLLESSGDRSLVELPRSTFNSGSRPSLDDLISRSIF